MQRWRGDRVTVIRCNAVSVLRRVVPQAANKAVVGEFQSRYSCHERFIMARDEDLDHLDRRSNRESMTSAQGGTKLSKKGDLSKVRLLDTDSGHLFVTITAKLQSI